MNKSELIAAMAEKSGLTQADASKALGAFCDSVSDALAGGGDIQITGFGGFSISERAARTGRNPQTGAEIQIAASKAPKFKAGKSLKDAVNG
ncbi:MAG: HU family DNA-binding protein [Alphaproteobacteria bacterium]|nr:HU family DNA-binding protein [Alphaproteobacteria bacterium]